MELNCAVFRMQEIDRFVTCDPPNPHTKYWRNGSVTLTVKW